MGTTDREWDGDKEAEELDEDELDVEVEDEDEDEDDEDEDDDLDDDELDAVLDEEDRQVLLGNETDRHPGTGGGTLVPPLPPSGNTPAISAEDLDADWGRADPVGEEAVGGTVATPDQDVVDEIGEAVGLTYGDDEPLDPTNKVDRRDANQWETHVDPRTEADYAERQREIDSGSLEKTDTGKKDTRKKQA